MAACDRAVVIRRSDQARKYHVCASRGDVRRTARRPAAVWCVRLSRCRRSQLQCGFARGKEEAEPRSQVSWSSGQNPSGYLPSQTCTMDKHPKVADEIQQELASFNAASLKHTETQEKVTLPSKEDVQQEKIHNSLLEGVEQFEKTSMKHAQTQEKVCLPKKEGSAMRAQLPARATP
ncbi:hypothetical protein V5799_031379 [Amblyomma americanum]|uniref:Uncharacterized protein n=1 Tax=Amblyomma americanum TaxID=6943 RepID=A0AAQ4EKJ7_AMBAM